MDAADLSLADLLGDLDADTIEATIQRMTPEEAQAILDSLDDKPLVTPRGPLEQAQALDEGYRVRDHLEYLSERLRLAVAKVEQGISQFMTISMPPRMGKSQLTSVYLILWLLHKHPEWPIGLISHDPSLAVKWGREVRDMVEERASLLGVELAKDSGAAGEWMTTKKGGVLSRSVGQSVTGRGFKVLVVDDAVKDYADAHSPVKREALWDWWLHNASTRQNGPWLVIFIGTRWHEDDVIGRLLSDEYEGDSSQWENIVFPAIAEDADVLGRMPGEPLLSPIVDETPEQALARWAGVERSVGSYAWAALYQQRPSAAKGKVFDSDWWRFWTVNPANATDDGKVVYLDLDKDLASAEFCDSWDCAFKATTSSDYVVGQRWARVQANRYLMYQERARLTFTQTLARMRIWGGLTGEEVPFTGRTHRRLVEDKANGTAVIDMLGEQIPGIKPINPTESKTARARAITPECESGNVFFPYPGDPGNEWVQVLLAELREFDTGIHDDQVDCLTQYLNEVRAPQQASVHVPGQRGQMPNQRRGQVALKIHGRYSGMVDGQRRG